MKKEYWLTDIIITTFLMVGLAMIYHDRYGWGWVIGIAFLFIMGHPENNEKKEQ